MRAGRVRPALFVDGTGTTGHNPMAVAAEATWDGQYPGEVVVRLLSEPGGVPEATVFATPAGIRALAAALVGAVEALEAGPEENVVHVAPIGEHAL